MMEANHVKEILEILISWPTATILVVVVLRRPLTRLIERLARSDSAVEAQLGPAVIRLGQVAEKGDRAVTSFERLSVLMAESRLLELEITEGKFGTDFSADQRKRMNAQIEELRKLTGNA